MNPAHMTAETTASLARLYSRTSDDIARAFPDLGEGIAAQFAELHRTQTRERAERLATTLTGALRELGRFTEAMQRESGR